MTYAWKNSKRNLINWQDQLSKQGAKNVAGFKTYVETIKKVLRKETRLTNSQKPTKRSRS